MTTFRGADFASAGAGSGVGGAAAWSSATRLQVTVASHPARGQATLSVARPAGANRLTFRPHDGHAPATRNRAAAVMIARLTLNGNRYRYR